MRQHEHTRDVQPLAEKRDGQRRARLPHGGQAVDNGILHRHAEQPSRVPADAPGRQRQHIGLVEKQPREPRRPQLRRQTQQRQIPRAQPEHAPEHLQHPVGPARTIVIPIERGAAGSDARRGAVGQRHEALHHRRAREQAVAVVPAVAAQRAVEQHDEQIVEQNDAKRQAADAQDAPHHRPAHPAQPQRQLAAAPRQRPQHEHQHARLRQHRGERRAPDAEPKCEHKHRVERGVHERAEHDRAHAAAGMALREQELVHARTEQHGRRPEHIEPEVRRRERIHCLAAAKHAQQRPGRQLERRREHDGQQRQQHEARAHGLLRARPVPLTE